MILNEDTIAKALSLPRDAAIISLVAIMQLTPSGSNLNVHASDELINMVGVDVYNALFFLIGSKQGIKAGGNWNNVLKYQLSQVV